MHVNYIYIRNSTLNGLMLRICTRTFKKSSIHLHHHWIFTTSLNIHSPWEKCNNFFLKSKTRSSIISETMLLLNCVYFQMCGCYHWCMIMQQWHFKSPLSGSRNHSCMTLFSQYVFIIHDCPIRKVEPWVTNTFWVKFSIKIVQILNQG